MKYSVYLINLVFFSVLAKSTAQAQSTVETPAFNFPLEVGNVWVYQDGQSNYPVCILFGGCYASHLRVTKRLESNEANCGLTQRMVTVTHQTWGTDVYSVGQSVVCQVENRIYEFNHRENAPTEFLEQDMIADFDRPVDQPWVIKYHPETSSDYRYTLRRRVAEIPPTTGRFGQADYAFVTYTAEHDQQIPEFDDYYTSSIRTFRSGIGFQQLSNFVLLGYYVDGVLTGDTTTVWATSIGRDGIDTPVMAALTSVYPNPFNPFSVIRYQITGAHGGTPVRVFVVDLLGREIAVLFDGMQAPGEYSATFDAAYLPSGVYVVVLRAGNTTDRRKITLMK
jgi:hypothetical protein